MKHFIYCFIFFMFFNGSFDIYANNLTDKEDNMLIMETTRGILVVEAYSDNIIRVRFHKQKPIGNHPELAILEQLPYSGRLEIGKDFLKTESLHVTVSKEGRISFCDLSGKILLQEGSRVVEKVNILGETAFSVQQRFKFKPDESIFGLGQHQSGLLNYRGSNVLLVQDNTVAVVPFFVSSNSYGLLWNNYSQTEFRDSSNLGAIWSELADGIDYFFISGKNTDLVIGGYRELTGAAPMFGKWAYGLWVCKEHYHTQSEVLNTAKEFRDRDIPFDNIVQDWFYWNPYPTGSHAFDKDRYPNPSEMVTELHNKYKAHVMISVWSKFDVGSQHYDEFIEKDRLLPTNYFDAHSDIGREIFWRQIKDSLYTKGFDAWWLDATEPELDQQPLYKITAKTMMNNALGTGARYLNTYSLLTSKAVYEGLRAETDEKRAFILTRSAFLGQQRYATATWSGDVFATWDVLHKQIVAGINFSLSGIPYWTTDIGGFTLNDFPGGNNNNEYKELYTRWFQFGAFSPLFRIHGSMTEREPWHFGEVGDWAYDIQLKYINLRYRLMPYIYSYAHEVTENHSTLMRGFVFDFPNDEKALAVDNQYMFGKNIMVCPVLDPMYFENWIETPAFELLSAEKTNDSSTTISEISDRYYSGRGFNRLLKDTVSVDMDYSPFDLFPDDSQKPGELLCVWETELQVEEDGTYQLMTTTSNQPWGEKVKLYVDSLLVIGNSHNMFNGVGKIANSNLKKGKKHKIKLEYICYSWETPRIRLSLRKATENDESALPEISKQPVRNVYLPEGNEWFDFWTGKKYEGGQTVRANASMDIIPLFVKAGSILPFGPKIQYATEMQADTIRLRVYQGADGTFDLYEDENDNYNYTKGLSTTIPINWMNDEKVLMIGNRKGNFPGALKNRVFSVVLVDEFTGYGSAFSSEKGKVVSYDGKEIRLSL
jgi:alpha-D-xyloside xylohydrolase